MEEAQGVRAHVSPGTGRRYPLTLICQVLRVPRSRDSEHYARPAFVSLERPAPRRFGDPGVGRHCRIAPVQ